MSDTDVCLFLQLPPCWRTACYAINTETLNRWTCAFKSWGKVKVSSPSKVTVHFRCIQKFQPKAEYLTFLWVMCTFLLTAWDLSFGEHIFRLPAVSSSFFFNEAPIHIHVSVLAWSIRCSIIASCFVLSRENDFLLPLVVKLKGRLAAAAVSRRPSAGIFLSLRSGENYFQLRLCGATDVCNVFHLLPRHFCFISWASRLWKSATRPTRLCVCMRACVLPALGWI